MKNEASNINSQEEYDKQKNLVSTSKLSLEQKTELSWQFLERITDIVANKFSAEDKKLIKEAGRLLADNGTTYKHQVDIEVRMINDKNKVSNVAKNKNGGSVRGV
ncbi:MAG: DUF2660 domain-containing protein [Rickettsiaceae bacterium]|nr:MAG: DUF2660 domain-containing protein [Rickettsiaceae bacterium]